MKLVASLALAAAALAAPAAARPADPFETFVASLGTDPKAAATRYQACQLLLAPNGEARTPCTLSLADLVGTQAGVTFKVTRLAYKDLSQSTVEYLDADVEARAAGKLIGQWHVVEIGGMGPPDGGFAPVGVHWARLIGDKDALARAKASTLPAAPAIADRTVAAPKGTDDQVVADRDEGVDGAKQLMLQDDLKDDLATIASRGVVWGSAPGQTLAGKSGAKGIKGWKLGLKGKGGVAAAGNDLIVVAAADIVGTTRDKTPQAITYAALIVMSMEMIPGSGDHVWYPRMISFAVPQ